MAPKQAASAPAPAPAPQPAPKPAAPAAAAKPAPVAPALLQPKPGEMSLPMTVVGPTDVSHLIRELGTIDDFLYQASIRKPGEPVKLPKASRMLDLFCDANKLNILQEADRKRARDYLSEVKEKAPLIHISFASDASSAFVEKIVLWLRTTIHPTILLRLGLEPTIAAGCIVRTNNKQFDFSLRHRFDEERGTLFKFLSDSTNE